MVAVVIAVALLVAFELAALVWAAPSNDGNDWLNHRPL